MTYYFAVAQEAAVDTHTTQETSGATEQEGKSILGLNGGAFVVQIITFIIVFALLKKFAFDRIVKLLSERHKTIDDGVRMGLRMEKEKQKLDEDVTKRLRSAREEADEIISAAQKEAREVIRKAEKSGQHKAEVMIAEAEIRTQEEAKQVRNKLEKELVGLVSEATETIVGDKIDARRDTELVAKAMKGRK